MSFNDLGLSNELLRAISDLGYTVPTPVQQQVIPIILEGKDILAGSQTGTGKTAGFTLPLLDRLSRTPKSATRAHVRALILTPTRELAAQVGESVKAYGLHLPLRSAVVFGGVNINSQIRTLRQGVDILIATPGRLLDHVSQKTVDLSRVEILVLDEADRMLDMGFVHEIKRVINLLPRVRQNLLFSATFSDEIKGLVSGMFHSPKTIEIAREKTTASGVTHTIYPVDSKKKRFLLSHIIHSKNMQQVLIFTRTKHGANRLSEQLELDGIGSAAIHGNKSQASRTRALAEFKKGTIRALVATDIAARGLDIKELPHVVNYELPNVPEDYVHRIGRTGRAGNEGEAISLVCIDEHKFLKDIERILKKEIPKIVVPGYEPDPSIKAVPILNKMRSQRRGNRNNYSAPRQDSRRTDSRGSRTR